MTKSVQKSPWRRSWQTVSAAVILVVAVAPFVMMMIGQPFLPSPAWAESSQVAALVVGCVVAVFFAIWVAGAMFAHYHPLRLVVARLAFAGVGFALGLLAVSATVPMVLALVAGRQMQITYVVENVPLYDRRGCRGSVDLQDMPPIYNSLCGIPRETRSKLTRGRQIAVEGRGTEMGLFPARIITAR